MDVVSVFLVILLISASILCIGIVIYFNRITKSIKGIEDDIKQISADTKPLVNSFISLSNNINGITESARDQVDMTKEIVVNIKDRVDKILLLEDKIRGGFEESGLDLIKNLSAIASGVSAFWNAYRKK